MIITDEAKEITDQIRIDIANVDRSVIEQIVQFTLNERDKCDHDMAVLTGY